MANGFLDRETLVKKCAAIASLGLAAGLTCAALTPAFARGPYRTEYLLLPPLEAKGCYYYRQHRYCGRYCYYEANGMRYCQPRAREAYPQAPIELEEAAPQHRRGHHSRSLK